MKSRIISTTFVAITIIAALAPSRALAQAPAPTYRVEFNPPDNYPSLTDQDKLDYKLTIDGKSELLVGVSCVVANPLNCGATLSVTQAAILRVPGTHRATLAAHVKGTGIESGPSSEASYEEPEITPNPPSAPRIIKEVKVVRLKSGATETTVEARLEPLYKSGFRVVPGYSATFMILEK